MRKLEFVLPKALKIELLQYNVLLSPLKVIMPNSVIKRIDNDIIDPNTGMRFDLDKSKEYEGKVNSLYEMAVEHPFQAIIVAIGPEAVNRGLKIGDLVYTDSQLHRSRRVVKYNGYIYTMIGVDSILGRIKNYSLETEELESIYI